MNDIKTDGVPYTIWATTDGSRKHVLHLGQWLLPDHNRVILVNSFLTRWQADYIRRLNWLQLFCSTGTSSFSLYPAAYDAQRWLPGSPHNPKHDSICTLWRRSNGDFIGYERR